MNEQNKKDLIVLKNLWFLMTIFKTQLKIL